MNYTILVGLAILALVGVLAGVGWIVWRHFRWKWEDKDRADMVWAEQFAQDMEKWGASDPTEVIPAVTEDVHIPAQATKIEATTEAGRHRA